jgi:hypothetical protein
MDIVTFAALFVLGVVCASNLIIARKPDAQRLIAKVAPYQGWIGALGAVWGAWWLINWFLHLGLMMKVPIIGITWLADSLLLLGLGILCGIGVFKVFIKSATATEKLDQAVTRMAPVQGFLGLAGIAVAVWTILDLYVFHI